MDRFLRPTRLDLDPISSTAEKDKLHWICTLDNFVCVLPAEGLNELQVLSSDVIPQIFEYIEHCKGYDDAVAALMALYIKPFNEVFARLLWQLSIRKVEKQWTKSSRPSKP